MATVYLAVLGWDSSNLLVNSIPNPLGSSEIQAGGGCTTCTGGKRLVSQVSGPTFIQTDAKEMYILEFADQDSANRWVAAFPGAFVGKQVYGHVRDWTKS